MLKTIFNVTHLLRSAYRGRVTHMRLDVASVAPYRQPQRKLCTIKQVGLGARRVAGQRHLIRDGGEGEGVTGASFHL